MPAALGHSPSLRLPVSGRIPTPATFAAAHINYRVEITRRAEADRDECFEYILEQSPAGADRWLASFVETAESLLANSNLGLAPESDRHDEPIRQRRFKTRYGLSYRLLFIVRGDVIHIIHVRGPGQDLMFADEIELPEAD
jgi:plasmid stabilization system protein ParE